LKENVLRSVRSIRSVKFFIFILVLLCVSNLFLYSSSRAFPVLPSSFYGTVQVDGANVQPGTSIKAMISNQVFAESKTIMYEGKSVCSLTIPGDDNDTSELDGGQEGDQITFEIGGVAADQTGEWHSGTNVELNLTASSLPGQVESGGPTPPTPSEDQPADTPLPNNPTAPAQAEISNSSLHTATIVPSSSIQADNEINTPNQIEQSMFETAVFEEEQQLTISTEEPLISQTNIANVELPVTITDENSPRRLLSFVSPIALLLGIGAIVIIIGVILWIRANWM